MIYLVEIEDETGYLSTSGELKDVRSEINAAYVCNKTSFFLRHDSLTHDFLTKMPVNSKLVYEFDNTKITVQTSEK